MPAPTGTALPQLPRVWPPLPSSLLRAVPRAPSPPLAPALLPLLLLLTARLLPILAVVRTEVTLALVSPEASAAPSKSFISNLAHKHWLTTPRYGYCGNTAGHCGTGCNPLFGKCDGVSASSSLASSTSARASSSSVASSSVRPSSVSSSTVPSATPSGKTSTDASCGGANGYTCIGFAEGECCSQYVPHHPPPPYLC
jgi:hypothetical protein